MAVASKETIGRPSNDIAGRLNKDISVGNLTSEGCTKMGKAWRETTGRRSNGFARQPLRAKETRKRP